MLLMKTDQSAQPLKGVQRVYGGNNANGTIEIIWRHMIIIIIMSTKIEQPTLKMTNQKRRQLCKKNRLMRLGDRNDIEAVSELTAAG